MVVVVGVGVGVGVGAGVEAEQEQTGIFNCDLCDKTFTKKKGGDFNGVAMGISGDTVGATFFCRPVFLPPWNI